MPAIDDQPHPGDTAAACAVEDARAGRVEALVAIMRQHNQRLYRIARSILRDDAEAEDVIQDAFLKAFTEIASLQRDDSIGAWLSRITVRLAITRSRQSRRRRQTFLPEVYDAPEHAETQGGDVHANEPTPERLAAMSDVRRLLEREIDRLPDGFREVFVARAVEQMTIEETAEALGIRPETVKTRLHRAKAMLRAGLEDHITAAALKAFPFGGARCERTSRAVLERLRTDPAVGSDASNS